MYNEIYVKLQNAARLTLDRHKSADINNPEENIYYAIIKAIVSNEPDRFDNFTRMNDARGMISSLSRDEILHCLFHNMIQLSEYRHTHKDDSLGDELDSYLYMFTEDCIKGNIKNIINEFNTGVNLIYNEYETINAYGVKSKEIVLKEKQILAAQRQKNNPNEAVSYKYANAIVYGYIKYNTTLRFIEADNQIKSNIDVGLSNELDKFYNNIPKTNI